MITHQKTSKVLKYLMPVPWLLAALFIFSFIWDFAGCRFSLFSANYSLQGLLRIVSVSGLIGFLTNWAAITMLFRPVEKRPLLGQGLIPSHKKKIAHRLARTVSDDLVNPEMIRKSVENSGLIRKIREQSLQSAADLSRDPAFRDKVKTWLAEYTREFFSNPQNRKQIAQKLSREVDTKLQNKPVEKAALRIYSLVKRRELYDLLDEALLEIPASVEKNMSDFDSFFDKVPDVLTDNSESADELIRRLLHNMIDRLDIYALVEQNLNSYDERKLESMIRGASSEQLKTIQYLGAVLGTIGGFVIWEPFLSLSAIVLLGGILYLSDISLSRVNGSA